MKRRGFLGLLAGAGLGVLAARTGLAQFALAIAEPELEALEGDFDIANLRYKSYERFTDPDAWFFKLGPLNQAPVLFQRVSAPPRLAMSGFTAIYGSSG